MQVALDAVGLAAWLAGWEATGQRFVLIEVACDCMELLYLLGPYPSFYTRRVGQHALNQGTPGRLGS